MSFTAECGDVVNHLMFQKAIIEDDAVSGREERIEGYVNMVNQLQQGTLAPSDDPFERSVATVFELVVTQKMNPWDINLIEFSKMYLAKVKKATELNLIVAGKIIYMAWEILKLQSEQVLQRVDRPDQVEMMFDGWNPDNLDLFVDPFELGTGEMMLYTEESLIDEKVRRKSQRPVTLIDLLDAFEEAKKESDIRQELAKFMVKYRRPEFDDKSHKESLEDDIAEVWDRIQKCGQGSVPIIDLYTTGKEDRVKVFISILFLARMGKIHIWQEKPPHGEIFLEVKVAWDIAQLEDATHTQTVIEAKIEDAPVVK
jgi:segregation and condensation protein A